MEEVSPISDLSLPDEVWFARGQVHPGCRVGVGILLHVAELDVVDQSLFLFCRQRMVKEGAKVFNDSHLVFLHILVPEKLEVWVGSVFPATKKVLPVRSIGMETFFEELKELLKGSNEGVARNQEVVMIVRDCRVLRIATNVDDLTGVQQPRREELQGKMRFDHSSSRQFVGVLDRIIEHLAELLIVRLQAKLGEEVRVDETE